MTTRLDQATSKIRETLEARHQHVFTETDLRMLLTEKRREWGLASSIKPARFIEFLIDGVGVRIVEMRSELYGTIRRYAWGEYSPFVMALSIRPRSYLSHGTAVFLNALNEQIPKTVYVNQEQSAKPSGSRLSQERLDTAFKSRQRTSGYVFSMDRHRVVLLSGKQTGNLGVSQLAVPRGDEHVPVTNIARTLIDIVVRPAYAGGISQVLEAYRGALGRVAGSDVVRVLQELDYVYPYHQAIGFLMERAGFGARDTSRLRRLGTKFDFYLAHGMKNSVYEDRWRLFIPEGF